MKIKNQGAPARSRAGVLAVGFTALALVASPAAAAETGDLVVWPRVCEEGYARPLHLQTDMRAGRAGLTWVQVGGPSVPMRELREGYAVADLSELDVARDVELVFTVTNGVRRASAGVVVRAADDRPVAATAAGTPETTPGGPGTLPTDDHGGVLTPGGVTPGGVDLLPEMPRAHRHRPLGVALSGVRSPDATPGGTDALPSDDHGGVLTPGGVTPGRVDLLPEMPRAHRHRPLGVALSGVRSPDATPGGTDALPSDDHGGVLTPGGVTPGRVDQLPGRQGARRDPFGDGRLQRWTALATFQDAGLDIIAFNVANRLALTTMTTFPAPLSWIDLSGFARDVEIATFEGTRYVLVAMGSEGIAVVDVDDPAQPVLVAEVRVSYGAEGVSFAGSADAAAPATINALAVDGTHLWIGDADYGVHSVALEQLLGRGEAR